MHDTGLLQMLYEVFSMYKDRYSLNHDRTGGLAEKEKKNGKSAKHTYKNDNTQSTLQNKSTK